MATYWCTAHAAPLTKAGTLRRAVMLAIHLPPECYRGRPEIVQGVAWHGQMHTLYTLFSASNCGTINHHSHLPP